LILQQLLSSELNFEQHNEQMVHYAAAQPHDFCLFLSNKGNYSPIDSYTAFDSFLGIAGGGTDWRAGICPFGLPSKFGNYLFECGQVLLRKGNSIERFGNWQEPFEFDLKPLATIPTLCFVPETSKAEYIHSVQDALEQIRKGWFYEVNLCQRFVAVAPEIDFTSLFLRLNELTKAPFAAFARQNGRWLACGSPERFLAKRKNRLISQPIKGTIRRAANLSEDLALKTQLLANQKERAENLMIVDLTRNDLSKNCLPGTVLVSELYGVHSYKTVHQLVSTIEGELKPNVSFEKAFTDAFPMGSMTGAPKWAATQWIEQKEGAQVRDWYSGSIGYLAPNGDADFNVVIRSLEFDGLHLSFSVGSAITVNSVAEHEYDECLLKAAAMLKACNGSIQELK